MFYKLKIKHQNLLKCIAVLIVIFCMFLWTSCSRDESALTDAFDKAEIRKNINCDGDPMTAPNIDTMYILNDSICCFRLTFSPTFLGDPPIQIIGIDSSGSSLALHPYGYCIGKVENYIFECCITTKAATITISLNSQTPHAKCVQNKLPCK